MKGKFCDRKQLKVFLPGNVSTFLRRENAVLLDENKQLKETGNRRTWNLLQRCQYLLASVHRLAVELSRYQARHPGGPPFKPKIKITSKQVEKLIITCLR